MAMYGSVGLCRAVCLYRAMYGYLLLCRAMYGSVWLCRAM